MAICEGITVLDLGRGFATAGFSDHVTLGDIGRMRQDPTVVPDTVAAPSQERLSLGVDVYKNLFTPSSDQLK